MDIVNCKEVPVNLEPFWNMHNDDIRKFSTLSNE
jgi:hypothetical protein